jgi:hypothetical protein
MRVRPRIVKNDDGKVIFLLYIQLSAIIQARGALFLLVFLHLGGTFGTVPLALHWPVETHALEVEPLDGTLCIVAANHLAKRHSAARAVSGLVRIDRHLHFRTERHAISP